VNQRLSTLGQTIEPHRSKARGREPVQQPTPADHGRFHREAPPVGYHHPLTADGWAVAACSRESHAASLSPAASLVTAAASSSFKMWSTAFCAALAACTSIFGSPFKTVSQLRK